MAVTLVVQDGTGKLDANSYVTVTKADSLLLANPYAESWVNLDSQEKAKYLILSSTRLDQLCEWAGTKKFSGASLRFPRYDVYDKDGNYYSSESIPSPVEEATAYLAWYYSSENRAAEFSDLGIDRVRVDVIEVRFNKGDRKSVIPREVSYILRGIARINSVQRVGRLVRS